MNEITSRLTQKIDIRLGKENPIYKTFPLEEEEAVIPSLQNLAARAVLKDPNLIETSKNLPTSHQRIIYSNSRGLETRLNLAKEYSEHNPEFAKYFQNTCVDVIKELGLPLDEKTPAGVLYRHISKIGIDANVLNELVPKGSLPKNLQQRVRVIFERSLIKIGSEKMQDVAGHISLALGASAVGLSFFYGTSCFFSAVASYAAPSLLQTTGFDLVTKLIAVVPGLGGMGGGLRLGEYLGYKVNGLQDIAANLGKSQEKKREESDQRELCARKELIPNIWLQDVLPGSTTSRFTTKIELRLGKENPIYKTFPLEEEEAVIPSLQNLAARAVLKDFNLIEDSKDLPTSHQTIIYSNSRSLETRLNLAKEYSVHNPEFAQYFQNTCGDVVKELGLPLDEKTPIEVLYRHIYKIGLDANELNELVPKVSLPKNLKQRVRVIFERSLSARKELISDIWLQDVLPLYRG